MKEPSETALIYVRDLHAERLRSRMSRGLDCEDVLDEVRRILESQDAEDGDRYEDMTLEDIVQMVAMRRADRMMLSGKLDAEAEEIDREAQEPL